ncbi:MAG: DUF309 domain-containing protein [Deltaproteobacteria bacterium]|nr:DUF309 domain-containing protein [Deltaproteobacteria bacterium]
MDARLREGVRLFNDRHFFKAHELLEDFYCATEDIHKPFIEGMIQLATACRLYCDFGETKGAVRMVRQALIRLENYQPTYLAVRVKDLINSMEAWANETEAAGGGTEAGIPKIRLQRFFFF